MIGGIGILGWLVPISIVQGGIVAAGVGLALWLLPRERMRLRHRVGLGALAILTASFLVTGALLLVDWNAHLACWNRVGEVTVSPACRSHGVPVPAGAASAPTTEKRAAVLGWRARLPTVSLPGQRAFARGWMEVAQVVGLAWLGILLLLGLREVRIRRAIRTLRTRSTAIRDAVVAASLEELVAELGIRGPVKVRESGIVDTPCVVGGGPPLILLPRGLLGALEEREVRGVLAHELAHVRNGDVATLGLQRAAESLLFFNPFARWISRRALEEREAICDRVGAEVGTRSRKRYARTLLLLEGFRASSPASAPALLGESKLARRVKRLLAGPPSRRRFAPVLAIALLVAGGTVAGALAEATLGGAALGSWGLMNRDNQHRERTLR